MKVAPFGVLLFALSAGAAAPTLKTAVTPLQAGEGVNEKTAQSLTAVLLAEVRRQPGLQVLSPEEVGALLGMERQQQLLGCSDSNSCVTEVAGALGADRMLMGSVAKLGESWLIQLKLFDTQKAISVGQADRRLKGKGLDEVLDELPGMVREVFKSSPATAAQAQVAAVTPAPVTPKIETLKIVSEPGGVMEPFDGKAENLVWLTDGKGHLIAVTPFGGTSSPLFAGDDQALFQQRVVGGGSSGTESFELTFWDSRIPSGWQRSFGFRAGKYELQCGDQRIAFTPLEAKRAAAVSKTAKLHKPRWRRAARALAVSDSGDYYFVDEPRDGDGSKGLRLFVGSKGAMRQALVKDVVAKQGADLFFLQSGEKVRMGAEPQVSKDGQVSKLEAMEVYDHAKSIYGDLGVYSEPLGSACDPFLAR